MPDTDREREWLDAAERETSSPGLPRPDLNPLVNPLLGQNMGRWAQVYFTSPPDQREQAVEKLLSDLQAESGGKKPAASHPPVTLDRVPAAPARKVEPDFVQHDLPVPQFTKTRHESPEPADHNVVICPGCLHKNAAEQRFCGLCGLSLTQEPGQRRPAPEPISRASAHRENPESDWEWLRQRTLADFEAVQEAKSGSRFLLGIIILLIVVVGGYFFYQNRDHASRQQVPASSPAATQSTPANSSGTPPPSPAASQPLASSKPDTQAVGSKLSHAIPAQPASEVAPSQPQTASSSDDGRDELDQGRRYLEGEGVPRNSWMASQWLWKAVAKQNGDAVLLLSDLYARGDGVPHSCEQARLLLIAAAKKGSSAAAQKLRSVETGCR
jgi:hypothetical protein